MKKLTITQLVSWTVVGIICGSILGGMSQSIYQNVMAFFVRDNPEYAHGMRKWILLFILLGTGLILGLGAIKIVIGEWRRVEKITWKTVLFLIIGVFAISMVGVFTGDLLSEIISLLL